MRILLHYYIVMQIESRLLSGADQAAVVGAYRLLKGLVVASGSDRS